MSALVEQRVSGWQGWPDDVRDRLRAWNKAFLLSFHRGPNFLCSGCARPIKAHPNGDAVVRPWRKAHGVTRCEDCLIALARAYEVPPESLAPRAHKLTDRLRARIDALEKRAARLRVQLELDQIYMDRLEEEIPADRLAAVRDELRGRYRRPA